MGACRDTARTGDDFRRLVKVLYISRDPAMRGWMNETKSYIAPRAIDDVTRAGAVARVLDYADRYGEAAREMAGWIKVGRLNAGEDIVIGIGKFPEALRMLFTDENTGELVRKPADE